MCVIDGFVDCWNEGFVCIILYDYCGCELYGIKPFRFASIIICIVVFDLQIDIITCHVYLES